MQTIKTVADFKKLIAIGAKVGCIFHMERAGRDEAGNATYKDLDRGIREVTIKQTNSFALKTWQEGKQKFVDSWCSYPKASEVQIIDNKITIFEENREGAKVPVLTYWIADKETEQPTQPEPAATNLNPLFIDQINNFAHLVTPEPQTKEQFLNTVKSTYSTGNAKTMFFYMAIEKSTFETIRLNNTRSAILFNQ